MTILVNLISDGEIKGFDFVGGKYLQLIVEKRSITFFDLMDKVHEELGTKKTKIEVTLPCFHKYIGEKKHDEDR